MRFKKAFTLAEAILTMMILGILAATMVTTLKPSQYKDQAFNTLKKKLYAELDSVTQTVLVECAKDMSSATIHGSCVKTNATHAFGTAENAIYAKYMRGTTGAANTDNSTCKKATAPNTTSTSLKLKNGACLYFDANVIRVDINGNEGPNTNGSDRMKLDIGTDGITTDMDAAITSSW